MKTGTLPRRGQIRWAGLIGSLVAVVGICADIALQYSPAGYGADFGAAHTALWRLLLGHYPGNFLYPLVLSGPHLVFFALSTIVLWNSGDVALSPKLC